MTSNVRTLAARRRRGPQLHPALLEAVDRRMHSLSARLAAGTVSLREATDELYDTYLRDQVFRARRAVVDVPGPIAEAHLVAVAATAVRDVEVDRISSEVPIAIAERRLGQVLVLPCGRSIGAKAPAAKPYDRPEDLW